MKIVLDPGDKVIITFSDCDGEITVDRPNESVVSVSADLPDLQGRVGEIYREDGQVEREDGLVFHPIDPPEMTRYNATGEATEADLQRLEAEADARAMTLYRARADMLPTCSVPDNYDNPPERGAKEEDW